MNEKKKWIILGALSVLIAGGIGALIYFQKETIKERRAEAERVRGQIADARELIKTTPDLVKEVIIQRETDTTIKEILSDQEDVNNFVRTLQQFEEESNVSISGMKLQKASRADKDNKEFQRVGYTLNMEADIFQLLSFMDRVESHSRFMAITAFKLSAARRQKNPTEIPRHRITLDLETYVYAPKAGSETVKIDQYERKRDLLISEISKRTAELQVPSYQYRGARGRRDPWVDPRVPRNPEGDFISIEQQIAIVDEMVEKAEAAAELWEQVGQAENLIAEMKARAALEEALAILDEEARRVESSGQLSFIPASRRFDKYVLAVADDLRSKMTDGDGSRPGPSVAALREAAQSMARHIDFHEYELALDAYKALEPRLAIAERDEFKRPLVQALRELEVLAKTVLSFEEIELSIGGIAIYEDRRPVALINGFPVSEGELIGDELIVRNIRNDQIEFDFRGLLLARPIEGGLNSTYSPAKQKSLQHSARK